MAASDYIDPKGYWLDPERNIRRIGDEEGQQEIIATVTEGGTHPSRTSTGQSGSKPVSLDRAMKKNPISLSDAYWILARRKRDEYRESTTKSGKWLIFIDAVRVEIIWRRVKQAVEDGLLGGRAKVSTAKQNPNSRNANKRVFCVYTYNYEDVEDVRRIREQLRRRGVTEEIAYKADEDIGTGRYRIKGHRQISKFFECTPK